MCATRQSIQLFQICQGGRLDVLAPHCCVLVPGSTIQGDAEDGIQFRERPPKRRQGTLGLSHLPPPHPPRPAGRRCASGRSGGS